MASHGTGTRSSILKSQKATSIKEKETAASIRTDLHHTISRSSWPSTYVNLVQYFLIHALKGVENILDIIFKIQRERQLLPYQFLIQKVF